MSLVVLHSHVPVTSYQNTTSTTHATLTTACLDFLAFTNTAQSRKDRDEFQGVNNDQQKKIGDTFAQLQALMSKPARAGCHCFHNLIDSHSKESEGRGHLRQGWSMPKKEAEVRKEKVALEADLEVPVFSYEKELAEAEALERDRAGSRHSVPSLKHSPTENKADRTTNYVNNNILNSDFDPRAPPFVPHGSSLPFCVSTQHFCDYAYGCSTCEHHIRTRLDESLPM